MRISVIYLFLAFFFTNCCAAQTYPKINFTVEMKWMDGERNDSVGIVLSGESYEWFIHRPALEFELILYSKYEEQNLFSHSDNKEFSVDSLRYDSIKIKSNNKSITIYDIPTYLIQNTKWLIVLNKKASSYCIDYVIHHFINSRERRAHVSHCKCCQDQNYLSISFPAINTIDFDLMDKLNNYLKEKKVTNGQQYFISRSFNYKDNCPYYFKEDFFWKQKESLNDAKIRDMLENKNWQEFAHASYPYKTPSFEANGGINYFDKGIWYQYGRSPFRKVGTYEIRDGQLITHRVYWRWDMSVSFYDDVYTIADLTDEYVIVEYGPVHAKWLKIRPPENGIHRKIWERID